MAPVQAADEEASVTVEIQGLEDALRENVTRFLTIATLVKTTSLSGMFSSADESVTTVGQIRRAHQLADEQIQEALVPFGYYLPRIESSLTEDQGSFVATYIVQPGPGAIIEQADISVVGPGAELPQVALALAEPKPEVGFQLSHELYEATKQRLFDAVYDAGFLQARWLARAIEVSADRRSARVMLRLQTGPRFYFGQVSVDQTILHTDYMRRFVQIRPGDPYDVASLLKLQNDLSLTNYFSSIEVQAQPNTADAQRWVPVRVVTTPAKRRKHAVGLGFGTDTGPRMKLSSEWRRVNKRGHRLRADLGLSSIEQGIGVRYEMPIRNVNRDMFALSARAARDETGDVRSDRYAVRAEQAVDWLGFRRTLYFAAERENFEFDSVPSQQSTLYYPGLLLSRERANDTRYATRGYGAHLDVRVGSRGLGSGVDFRRVLLTGRWLRGLGSRSRLILGAQAGALWTNDFDRLPPAQRFFAGGDRSVRGYSFEDIGLRNAGGDVIGGRRLLAASVELERLLVGNYGAAVFVDAGDAFANSPDLKLGAGIGLRWRSPVGMVRLDLAHPFDDDDKSVRVHFTIGATL